MTSKISVPASRRRLLLLATAVFVLLAVGYGLWWWIYSSHFESTDDAYIHGNLVQITPQVAGTVVAIAADDTEWVKAGQPLVQLDPADAEAALAQARAQLAQAVRQTRTRYVQNEALQADVSAREADLQRVQADLARARTDLDRRQKLARTGGVSGEELQHAQTALRSAQSQAAQAQAALEAAQAMLETNQALTRGTDVAHHPDVQRAAAQLREAWLARERTALPAPVDGMVARRSVQVGQRVAPGAALMSVVALDQLWVEANFKENQLRNMRVGQPVTLVSDLHGDRVRYHGVVSGLDAGTGSAFALLPAQNATGNWIKVVQRVPVRIRLDPTELAEHPLRIGLSMTVEVDVGDEGHAVPAVAGLQTDALTLDQDVADALIDTIIRENLAS
ncbi:HlyD family efflux transporter periplasmic adaptor subunit [Corticimicrobacter populi]|uniref:EmrA/EmrK family multidrug efflux transporter periplasmic adaptor subunit n=1 Tax=Corticimicrobacter populi TaxID=2175229 RepID=A0A2V1JZI1_9BURK|nr:HlyD family efflux transporter periplasmic adaptor subunit [Corticimicrobacter populi]PWF21937.1 EmrA/EmrK family multidrug efflux transporter periplasmic adaptor subunit [Corticimicrobacter populi]